MSAPTRPAARAAPPALGELSERYTRLEEVGAGGMGVVYRAYDTKLQRTVALKVVADSPEQPGEALRALREAQALATLSHPNVVAVFDADRWHSGFFIAMEYVDGISLKQWMQTEEHAADDVITTFIEAGRGLAAAHTCGLVHRDFKPSNVLIGIDDRVRVVDFGLALGSGVATEVAAPMVSPPDYRVTLSGVIIGTPAYMAPEQHLGKPADPASDQYAFCVALYEGLVGRLPFDADKPEDLLAAKRRGPPQRPRTARVTSQAWRVLRRGLEPDAARRWPSMHAMLAKLGARRKRRWLAVIAVVPLVAVVMLGTWGDDACGDGSASFERVWNERRAEVIHNALANAPVPYAADTWQRTSDRLEHFARAWTAAWPASCVDGTEAEVACMLERVDEFDVTLAQLAEGDPSINENAIRIAAHVVPPHRCSDPTFIEASFVGGADRVAATELRRKLARASVLAMADRDEDASDIAWQVADRAESLGLDTVRLEALMRAGMFDIASDPERAVERLHQAHELAVQIHAPERAAEAAAGLAYVVAIGIGDAQRALGWASKAKASLREAGDHPEIAALVSESRAVALYESGHAELAVDAFDEVIGFSIQAYGTEWFGRPEKLYQLGEAQRYAGRYDDAERSLQEALRLTEEHQGRRHPAAGHARLSLGVLRFDQGRYEEALALGDEALAVLRAAKGDETPDVIRPLTLRGAALQRLGRGEEAAASFELARQRSRAHGRAAEEVSILTNLGVLAAERGDLSGALQHYDAALALLRSAAETSHPRYARLLANSAFVLADLGRPKEALSRHEEAMAIRRKRLGADHKDVANSLLGIALVQQMQGDRVAARANFERGLAIHRRLGLRTDETSRLEEGLQSVN